jgi:DNA-binding transcriptional MerR regulator
VKAEDVKLPGAGISLKQCPRKCPAEKADLANSVTSARERTKASRAGQGSDGRRGIYAAIRKKGLTLDYTPGCSFHTGVKVMQIGIVAKRIGLSVDAIRFYERNALLPRAARTEGGFRQYGESDVETLAFIRRVQGLGFKLSEIRALLRLRGNRLQPCAPVRRRLQEKLVDVQQKLIDLHKLEHELRLALRSCNKELRKRSAHCPILQETKARKPESAE